MKTPALTIKQPWASLIAHGFKDIENRTWRTNYRGRIYIHASAKIDPRECHAARDLLMSPFLDFPNFYEMRETLGETKFRDLPTGAILGTAEIVDCVTASESPWFCGPYGFVLKNIRRFEKPMPCRGALSFWNPMDKLDAEDFAKLQLL
jgi:hypothetical protein